MLSENIIDLLHASNDDKKAANPKAGGLRITL
jgi:hypothetical protein